MHLYARIRDNDKNILLIPNTKTTKASKIYIMKKLLTATIFVLALTIALKSIAQPMVNKAVFSDAAIQSQADSIKDLYSKMGFVVAKESGMNMESEYETPVILPLKQGTWYRIVFIGDYTSRLYEVRMFDWNEKQVFYAKKMWGDVDGNIISYDYVPQFTEYHLVKPVQINKKKKQVGGYFLIFKKTIP